MNTLQQRRQFGFALGGLAGNNAHGAGVLQAAIDRELHPYMITCTSGQIHWVYKYLEARANGQPDLESTLREDIEKTSRSGNEDIDMVLLAVTGHKDVLRSTFLREYPFDILKNALAATIDILQKGSHASYLKELLDVWPARTLMSLRDQPYFEKVSEAFNESDTGIAFNSYDPHQGIEIVHLNERARDLLGGKKAGDKSSYRERTLYKDITPQYVRDGLWIYEYGFGDQSTMVDGAYYRQIMLSELAKAKVRGIVVARPINTKWIGDLPQTWVQREDLKTEVSFNGLYQAERDKIMLINRLVHDKMLPNDYQHVHLVELEIETQESFFDYVFEDLDVFVSARTRADLKLRRLADAGYESAFR